MRLLKYSELWAGGLAALLLLAGTFVVGAPVWPSLLVAICFFIGLNLLASYWTDILIQAQARGISLDAMRNMIQEGMKRVQEIKTLAKSVEEVEIRKQLSRICELALRIFENFKEDPSDVSKAGRFLLYLDRFLPLIERYARLSSTPAGKELLKRSADDKEFKELLDVMEKGFSTGFQNYLKNDVVELRTLSRVMKKMMNVAEIGE